MTTAQDMKSAAGRNAITKGKRSRFSGAIRLGWGFVAGLCLMFAVLWQPDRSVDSLERRWAGPPSQWLTLDVPAIGKSTATQIRLHLRDTGPRNDAEPIVLLHGTGASMHTWDAWAGELSQTRRVVRIDLPGYGLTGPFDDHDYSMPRYSALLTTLAESLRLSPSIFVGNSLGGLIAWEHAVAAPSRVTKLVLIDAAGYPMAASSVPLGFKIAQLPVLNRMVSSVLPKAVIESSIKNVYGDPSKVSDALVERYFELTLRQGNRTAVVKGFEQRREAIQSGESAARIKAISQPTFILWGAQDRLIPPENAQKFKRDITISRLAILEGLGHVPMEEDPVRSLAAVRGFLGK